MKHAWIILALAGTAVAQTTQPQPKADPPSQPAAKEAPRPPPPDLDDLLGLTPDKRPAAAPDPAAGELERELSLQEAADQFKVAVGMMGVAATRLGASRDTGLDTQRMQESIIRKLDMLIKAAEQQSQRSRSSRSSSQQSNPDQQNQPQQPQPGENEGNRGDNRDERVPPGRQNGDLSPEEAARGAAWGALPERMRDALLQGTQDTYSSLYQRLTESYFRKLAEEPR